MNLKLKKKPATVVHKRHQPIHQLEVALCVKPASETVRALAMKKLKEMVNRADFLSLNIRVQVGGPWSVEKVCVRIVKGCGHQK